MSAKAKRNFSISLALLAVFITILPLLLQVGCRNINPEIHDEYFRHDLDPAISNLCKQHSLLIPEIMESEKIPGISVALIDRKGIIWAAGFGFTDYDCKTPVTRDTRFLINSSSKTFTALAVMCAVQDGVVELDVPISAYLPEFTVNSRLENRPQDKITLRHLLSHVSGMTREAPVGNTGQPSYGSFEDHVNSITNTWLRFPVGANWEYSSAGFDLAAYILQVQAKKPYGDYLNEKVLLPLDMKNTTVDGKIIEADSARSIGHASRHYIGVPLMSDIPMDGAGGVYSTANDLARFVRFFLCWGAVDEMRLLDEKSMIQMYSPSAYANYGLGVEIYKGSVGHGGDGLGFSSEIIWSSELGIGGVILINSLSISNHHDEHREWLIDLLTTLKDEGYTELEASKRPGWISPENLRTPQYSLPDPETFTPYQDSWKKYTGRYNRISKGWELRNYAQIAVSLGYNPDIIEVKEIDGYLCVNGEPVDEYRPGIFLTAWGACLDFTEPIPMWDSYQIKKHKGIIP